METSPNRPKEKSVIIHRDETGFGFRVTGQNPVHVEWVYENGAAWKAGVRREDKIIKVNGTLVKTYDHQTVVNMIQQCTPFVNLTLHTDPNPETTPPSEANSTINGIKPKIQTNKNQDVVMDNPYYYYKNEPDKSGLDSISGAKHKSKKLRSRIIGDFRSLTINQTNLQSSLSTSPSSSDLSDCDDTEQNNRPDLISLNTSSNSISSKSISTNALDSDCLQKPRQTTRRSEIIRELVDTEKTHTERLKHLNDLLYKPIKAEGLVPLEQLKMIFSCHKTLFKIHRQIYKILVKAQQNISDDHHEPLIGAALVEIFEGDLGARLEKAASSFCACQSINTELLKRFTRKDTKAGEFLAQVASQQLLGRLGIKDLLASCFQRLTKYPLLLDNLLKATPTTSPYVMLPKSLSDGSLSNPKSTYPSPIVPQNQLKYERLCISRALYASREILTHVNEAVNKAISLNRLRELWKKADRGANLPDIDIDTQKVIHEGPLTLQFNRRSFEVYVMLLSCHLVILTKEGPDKFKLKPFISEGKTPNQQLLPVFTIDEHLATRDLATNENIFYLLCKSKNDSRIYQFSSQSPIEKAKWKEKIHMVQQYNFPVVPDDENTLTRYRELITLATSCNTPNNIEQL